MKSRKKLHSALEQCQSDSAPPSLLRSPHDRSTHHDYRVNQRNKHERRTSPPIKQRSPKLSDEQNPNAFLTCVSNASIRASVKIHEG